MPLDPIVTVELKDSIHVAAALLLRRDLLSGDMTLHPETDEDLYARMKLA